MSISQRVRRSVAAAAAVALSAGLLAGVGAS
jgi:hypothetical protein